MEKRKSPVSRREGGAMGFYEEKWRLMGLFFISGKSSLHTSTSSLNPSLYLLLCVEFGIISFDTGEELLFSCLSLFSVCFCLFSLPFRSPVLHSCLPFHLISFFFFFFLI